jgi:hypothetical protein
MSLKPMSPGMMFATHTKGKRGAGRTCKDFLPLSKKKTSPMKK